MIYLESVPSENIKQCPEYVIRDTQMDHAKENMAKSKPSPMHEVANFHFSLKLLVYPCTFSSNFPPS